MQSRFYDNVFLSRTSSFATRFPKLQPFLTADEHESAIQAELGRCRAALNPNNSNLDEIGDRLYNFLAGLPATTSLRKTNNPLSELSQARTNELKTLLKNELVADALLDLAPPAPIPPAPAPAPLDYDKHEVIADFLQRERADLARIFNDATYKNKIATALNRSDIVINPDEDEDEAKLDEFAACTSYAEMEKITEKLGLPKDRDFINAVIEKNRAFALEEKLEGDAAKTYRKNTYRDNKNNKQSAKENSKILERRQPDDRHGGLDKIKTIEEWAAFAPYMASRVADTAKLNQAGDTAYALKTKLEILKADNQAHKKRCEELENDPAKQDKKALYDNEIKNTNNRIKTLNEAIKRLDNAMNNIKIARKRDGTPKKTAFYSSIGDASTIHNASPKANENYKAAEDKVANFFESKVVAGVAHMTNASGLQTDENLQVMAAKAIIDETLDVKTAIIQTTFAGPDKARHRQDLFIDNVNEQSIQLMSEYQGFGFNKLPADRVMQWAMKVVSNYQALSNTAGEVVTIHAGNFPNACVEAMMIVCKARGVDYMVTGRLMECNIDKLVEKAIKRYDVLAAQLGSMRPSDRLMSEKAEDTQLAPPSPSKGPGR